MRIQMARMKPSLRKTEATPELGTVKSKASRLTPEEIGALSKKLSECRDPAEAERLKERLARGFCGVRPVPKKRIE